MRRHSPARSGPWAWTLVGGALFGLGLFLAESWLIAHQNLAGLSLNTEGMFKTLTDAVRPVLPGLLARVFAVYLCGGALLGFLAGLLTSCWNPYPRAGWVLLWWVELFTLTGLLFYHRAVLRPALVDDLLPEPLLAQLLEMGHPAQAVWSASVLLLFHLLVAAKNRPEVLTHVGAVGLAFIVSTVARVPMVRSVSPQLLVLIGVDAFRPDRIDKQGVAPNIRAFVAEATRFDQAYTPIAQTEPAWRSMLTARWPHRTGNRYPLTSESRWAPLPTFVSELEVAGWSSTFATDCSRFHFEPSSSGFGERVQPPRGALNFLLEKLRYRALGAFADNALGARLVPEFVDNRALAGIHDPMGYAQRLADHWSEQALRGPAVLAFHATAAHFPGDPVFPFYRSFVPPSEPARKRTRMHFAPVSTAGQGGGWTRAGSEALYDELLAQADAQVGILLKRLREEGLYDRALIVLFSDHGESFHPDRPDLQGATPVHGVRLSEEENRILLAIKWPLSMGIQAGAVGDLVRLVDIGPTLLEVVKVKPMENVDGVSLLPLARGQRRSALRLYAETGFTHVSPDVLFPGHRAKASRTFEAYQIRPDGVVEASEQSHQDILGDKDHGAFDGEGWLIRRPNSKGEFEETCVGTCSDTLREWFENVRQQGP